MPLSRYRNVSRPDKIYPNVVISDRDTDLFIEYSVDDRLDLIAHRIYGEASYWWIIMLANPEYDMEYSIEPGELLRIPLPLNDAVAEIKDQL